LSISQPICDRLLQLVSLEVPCKSSADLLKVDINTVYRDLADNSTVSVTFIPVNDGYLMQGEIGKVRLGLSPERLIYFWRVNSGQANHMRTRSGI
jgi:hypothetical protein